MERIIALMALASKDFTRSHLCGVFVTRDKLRVTDGYKMSEESHSIEIIGNIDEGFLIPRDALAVLKQFKRERHVEFKVSGNDLTIMSPNTRCSVEVMRVSYPDFKAFMPKGEQPYTIGLNANYLKDIAKALDSREGFVKLSFDDEKRLITVTCGERTAVLAAARV